MHFREYEVHSWQRKKMLLFVISFHKNISLEARNKERHSIELHRISPITIRKSWSKNHQIIESMQSYSPLFNRQENPVKWKSLPSVVRRTLAKDPFTTPVLPLSIYGNTSNGHFSGLTLYFGCSISLFIRLFKTDSRWFNPQKQRPWVGAMVL